MDEGDFSWDGIGKMMFKTYEWVLGGGSPRSGLLLIDIRPKRIRSNVTNELRMAGLTRCFRV